MKTSRLGRISLKRYFIHYNLSKKLNEGLMYSQYRSEWFDCQHERGESNEKNN